MYDLHLHQLEVLLATSLTSPAAMFLLKVSYLSWFAVLVVELFHVGMLPCFRFLFVGLNELLSCIFLLSFCGSMFVLLGSLNILLLTWAYLGSSLLNEVLGNSSLSTLIAVLVACCFSLRFSLDFLNFLWCKIFFVAASFDLIVLCTSSVAVLRFVLFLWLFIFRFLTKFDCLS